MQILPRSTERVREDNHMLQHLNLLALLHGMSVLQIELVHKEAASEIAAEGGRCVAACIAHSIWQCGATYHFQTSAMRFSALTASKLSRQESSSKGHYIVQFEIALFLLQCQSVAILNLFTQHIVVLHVHRDGSKSVQY
eukprot:6477863-Amphidinium_carterae.1